MLTNTSENSEIILEQIKMEYLMIAFFSVFESSDVVLHPNDLFVSELLRALYILSFTHIKT